MNKVEFLKKKIRLETDVLLYIYIYMGGDGELYYN